MFFFFFNDTATTEIYTLSLHDALPICALADHLALVFRDQTLTPVQYLAAASRSEEHTSELQSRPHLVCRLLLEKKKLPRRGEPRLLEPRGARPVQDTRALQHRSVCTSR